LLTIAYDCPDGLIAYHTYHCPVKKNSLKPSETVTNLFKRKKNIVHPVGLE
jgi:hypothetical protein